MIGNATSRRAGFSAQVDAAAGVPLAQPNPYQSIQNRQRIAANESAFDILFTADDSGESYLWQNMVHKQPDGTRLIA